MTFTVPKFELFTDDATKFLTGKIEIPGGSPIVVKIVKDSITEGGSRLVTWTWEYWRSIHEEIMTHRALSRNSASSRAIPAKRMREMICAKPAIPIYWGQNQKGMQASAEIDDVETARKWWLEGLDFMAAHHAKGEALGLHKQIVNRAIQPWMTMAVVVSATDHANLFHLRKHHAAEPHFQCIATLAWELFHNHMPTFRTPGDWHLPYIEDADQYRGADGFGVANAGDLDFWKRVSVGRCARVSYLTHEGKRDPQEDIRLHDQLAQTATLGADPMHASPFEHQAVAMGGGRRYGNFEGWRQYRKLFKYENGPDTNDRCFVCGCWGGRHVQGCTDTA